APLLPTRHAPLALGEEPLSPTIIARREDACPSGQRGAGFPAELYAGFLAGRWQGVSRHLGTGDRDVPPIRLVCDSNGLWGTFQGAGPMDGNPLDLRQDQMPIIQGGPVAILFAGEAVPAVVPFEAWEARLLAPLHPTEEGVIGLVQPRQHILQHVAVDRGVRRELRADDRELGFLLVARDRDVATLPGSDAVFQGDIVEGAAAPEYLVHHPLLCGCWAQFLL